MTLEWKRKSCGTKVYDRRFIYWEAKDTSNPSRTFHKRTTRVWWRPIEWLGTRIERVTLYLYNRNPSYSSNGSGTTSPYIVRPYGQILSWLRRRIFYTVG